MDNVATPSGTPDTPWRSSLFWWVMGPLLVAILGLTTVKDYALTGQQPNALFYITVPVVSMAGATLGGFAMAGLLRQAVGLADMLAIVLITTFLGQVYENISKLVWYLVWEYPGWLYLLAVLALGLLVPAYCLVRWLELRWPPALVVAVSVFFGEMILGLAFVSLTGISTPGS